MRLLYGFGVTAILFASPASAEIVNCGGVWTNLNCGDAPSERFDEKNYVPPSPEELERRQRETLHTSFDLRRRRAERELGITLSASEVRSTCLQGTLKECQDAVGIAERHLNEQVFNATALKARAQAEAKQNQQQSEQVNTVTIIDNRPIIVRRPHMHDHYDRRVHRHEQGAQVQGSVRLDGGNTTIHGRVESRQTERRRSGTGRFVGAGSPTREGIRR